MISVSIQGESTEANSLRFRAIAGKRQSIGHTAGEALDSLLAEGGDAIESSLILIQRFAPDSYFTQAQHDRLRELMAKRPHLSAEEGEELDALIDAELDATVARTDAFVDEMSK